MTLRAWLVVASADPAQRDKAAEAAGRFLARFGRGGLERLPKPLESETGCLAIACDLRLNRQPAHPMIFASHGGVCLLAFDGWLENADDIAAELGLGTTDASSDEVLVARSIDRWGEDAVHRLVGEYSFVAWRADRGLLAARDKVGVRPLFHTALREGWACSNLVGLLACLPGVPDAIDWDAVAAYVCGVEALPEETLIQSIRRLDGGHALFRSPAGELVRHRYWKPRPDVLKLTRAEAVEEVGCRVRAAVRGAARGYPFVASHLSGGIDSSSVSLVLDELHASGALPGADAATVSMVYPGLTCDETPFIDAVAGRIGLPSLRFEPRYASLEWMRQGTERLDQPLVPQHATAQLPLLEAVAERSGVLLTGEGGDELFEPTDRALRRAIAQPRAWSSLAVHARHRWQDRDRSMRLAGQLRHCLESLLGEATLARIDGFRGRHRTASDFPIDADWARQACLVQRSLPQPTVPEARSLAMAFTLAGAWATAWDLYFPLVFAQGVEERHPLSSSELVAFCNRLPLGLLDGQTTFNRQLLRDMHGSRLPECVRKRRGKVEFSQPTLPTLRARIAEQGYRPGQSVTLAGGRTLRLPAESARSIWLYERPLSYLLWQMEKAAT